MRLLITENYILSMTVFFFVFLKNKKTNNLHCNFLMVTQQLSVVAILLMLGLFLHRVHLLVITKVTVTTPIYRPYDTSLNNTQFPNTIM